MKFSVSGDKQILFFICKNYNIPYRSQETIEIEEENFEKLYVRCQYILRSNGTKKTNLLIENRFVTLPEFKKKSINQLKKGKVNEYLFKMLLDDDLTNHNFNDSDNLGNSAEELFNKIFLEKNHDEKKDVSNEVNQNNEVIKEDNQVQDKEETFVLPEESDKKEN